MQGIFWLAVKDQELTPIQSEEEEELAAPETTDTAPPPTTPYNAVLTFQGLVVQLFEEKEGQEGSVVRKLMIILPLSFFFLSVYLTLNSLSLWSLSPCASLFLPFYLCVYVSIHLSLILSFFFVCGRCLYVSISQCFVSMFAFFHFFPHVINMATEQT